MIFKNKLGIKCFLLALGIILGRSGINQAIGGPSVDSPAQITPLHLTEAWIRPAHAGHNTAAYLRLYNPGPDTLYLSQVKGGDSDTIELHTHTLENGISRMRELKNGIELKVGQVVLLQPGGLHIMVCGLKQTLVDGHSVTLILCFKKSLKDENLLEIPVRFVVISHKP